MLVPSEGICVGKGQYGPFENGRTIPYIDWADAEGGVYRATVSEGVSSPAPMEQGRVHLDLFRKDNGLLALRLQMFEPALAHAA